MDWKILLYIKIEYRLENYEEIYFAISSYFFGSFNRLC